MHPYRLILIYLISVLSLLTLGGCGSFSSPATQPQSKSATLLSARKEVASLAAEPNKITLMLPLTGPLASTSQIIKQGFLSAYYHSLALRPSVQIKIVDTTKQDIRTSYQQAILEGTEVIVGPLTKTEVEALVADPEAIVIPTITLNTLDNYTDHYAPNLYQFGLLPQDEATQTALRMLHYKLDHCAVIAPNNAWGKKITAAFSNTYESSGGKVVAVLNYDSRHQLAEQLCRFICGENSPICERGSPNPTTINQPMRRQDINGIFLVTTAAVAKQLVPLLKFYYAGDLPTYAISSIHSGMDDPNSDRDLDNIQFCDIPALLPNNALTATNQELKFAYEQIAAIHKQALPNHRRLYALGMDAYYLAAQINNFFYNVHLGVDGASGKLFLDNYNHIYRELTWAQFQHGLKTVMTN